MYSDSDDELCAGLAALTRRSRLQLQRARCLKFAKAAGAGGLALLLWLWVMGMKPASVAVPLVLAVVSLLFAAGSAALFARAAGLSLDDRDPGADDDDRGSGGGGDEPPVPTGGGGLQFDWQRFEREFRCYCEQSEAALVS